MTLVISVLIFGLILLNSPIFTKSMDSMAQSGPAQHYQKHTCGASTVRLNMAMHKLYGKWYPIDVSEEAYKLWMSSLYGKYGTKPTQTVCPTWEFKQSSSTMPGLLCMTVEIVQDTAKINIEAVLLSDASHPGKSKWLMSWPTGENTLTSIVATGSLESNSTKYDWLLTMDCDASGDESPDWAIFSRDVTLNSYTVSALKAVVEGIPGVDPKDSKAIGQTCKKN